MLVVVDELLLPPPPIPVIISSQPVSEKLPIIAVTSIYDVAFDHTYVSGAPPVFFCIEIFCFNNS